MGVIGVNGGGVIEGIIGISTVIAVVVSTTSSWATWFVSRISCRRLLVEVALRPEVALRGKEAPGFG